MVRFTEWTTDNLLRQPVYLGLRDDKPATDVVREESRPPKAAGPLHASRREARTAHGDLVEQLHDLEDAREDGDLQLPGGDTLRVTNLAKVFWPNLGITKGDLLRYYAEVSPLLLPVIDDRPLVMKRFPNGIAKSAFYQQRHPEDVPPGVRRERLPDDIDPMDEDGPRDRLIGGSIKTLLYMTQIAAISQDPWFSRVGSLLDQDHAAIDLDPGDGVPFSTVVDVARWVKDELDRLGLPGVPKTSGSRGLHIYLPLPRGTTYQTGQLLCQIVATLISTAHPKAATVERMGCSKKPTARHRLRRLPTKYSGQDAGHRLFGACERLCRRVHPALVGRGRARTRPQGFYDSHGAGTLPRGRRPLGAPSQGEGGQPRGRLAAGCETSPLGPRSRLASAALCRRRGRPRGRTRPDRRR